MFFAAPVFGGSRLAVSIRVLMIVSGVLALVGLSGVVAGDMQLRNIGIVGYVGGVSGRRRATGCLVLSSQTVVAPVGEPVGQRRREAKLVRSGSSKASSRLTSTITSLARADVDGRVSRKSSNYLSAPFFWPGLIQAGIAFAACA